MGKIDGNEFDSLYLIHIPKTGGTWIRKQRTKAVMPPFPGLGLPWQSHFISNSPMKIDKFQHAQCSNVHNMKRYRPFSYKEICEFILKNLLDVPVLKLAPYAEKRLELLKKYEQSVNSAKSIHHILTDFAEIYEEISIIERHVLENDQILVPDELIGWIINKDEHFIFHVNPTIERDKMYLFNQERSLIFSVVRNPFELLVSRYFYAKRKNLPAWEKYQNFKEYIAALCSTPWERLDPECCMEHYCENNFLFWQIFNDEGDCVPHILLRTEQLKEGFAKLASIMYGSQYEFAQDHYEYKNLNRKDTSQWIFSSETVMKRMLKKEQEIVEDPMVYGKFLNRYWEVNEGLGRSQEKESLPLNEKLHSDYREHYDEETREMVEKRFFKELRAFGYTFDGPIIAENNENLEYTSFEDFKKDPLFIVPDNIKYDLYKEELSIDGVIINE